jgi:hypothetical protein
MHISLHERAASCLQVFYSYLLGAIFFHDRITPLGLLGVALILAGVLLVTVRPAKRSSATSQLAAAAAAATAAAADEAQPGGASRAASLAAAAGVGQREAAALTSPTLSRRTSAKEAAAAAAAAAKAGVVDAKVLKQPLLQNRSDMAAKQPGAGSVTAADAAVIITAARPVTQSEAAAASSTAATAEGSSVQDGDNAPLRQHVEEPGVLSAFVQAALQSSMQEGAGSPAGGKFLLCQQMHYMHLNAAVHEDGWLLT